MEENKQDNNDWDNIRPVQFSWSRIINISLLVFAALMSLALLTYNPKNIIQSIIILSVFWLLFIPLWRKRMSIYRYAETDNRLEDNVIQDNENRKNIQSNTQLFALDNQNFRELNDHEKSRWVSIMEELQELSSQSSKILKRKDR